MSEIASCPLCGKDVNYKIIGHYHQEICVLEQHQIRCQCGLTFEARISPTAYRYKELVQEFLDKWNIRIKGGDFD